MYRNIIWDVDGTLFNTYPAIAGAFQAALHDLGQDAPLSWIEAQAKISLGHCASALAEIAQVDADTLADHFDVHYQRTPACDQPPFPGVKRICESICAGGGKNVIITHRDRAATLALLAEYGMTDLFSGWLTRDDGLPKKPDPTAFLYAMERYEMLPEETMAVGDRDIDVEAGKGAGVFTCLLGEPGSARPGLLIEDYRLLKLFLESVEQTERE